MDVSYAVDCGYLINQLQICNCYLYVVERRFNLIKKTTVECVTFQSNKSIRSEVSFFQLGFYRTSFLNIWIHTDFVYIHALGFSFYMNTLKTKMKLNIIQRSSSYGAISSLPLPYKINPLKQHRKRSLLFLRERERERETKTNQCMLWLKRRILECKTC